MAKLKKPVPFTEPPRLVGYARVSTEEQILDLQLDALRRAGVMEDNLHHEKLSAVAKNRPELRHAILDLHEGDTLVVWKLDRLARNMSNLLDILKEIEAAGCTFRSLTESFDTATPAGKLMMHMLGAFAQFERDMTVARTGAGMRAAKERGVHLGRETQMTGDARARALKLLQRHSVGYVARKLKVSRPTIYNHFEFKTVRGVRIVKARKKMK